MLRPGLDNEARSDQSSDSLLGRGLETRPELARHLPALRELAVNTNSLTALPDGIGQLKRLQSLVVRAPRPAAPGFATVA